MQQVTDLACCIPSPCFFGRTIGRQDYFGGRSMVASASWGEAFGDLGLSGQNKAALMDELRYRIKQREIQAREEQALMARHTGERYMLECGEQQLQVHQFFYHYWGQKLGYECWADPEFLREFIRDNDEVRVKNHSRKLMVGYEGAGNGPRIARMGTDDRAQAKPKKFHKVYS